MHKISDEFKSEIKLRVAEVEGKTGLELVPVFVRQSSSYFSLRILYLIIFGFIFFEIFYLSLNIWDPEWRNILSVVLGVLGSAFCVFTPIFRRLIPTAMKRHKVEQQALRSFLLEEVFATEKRSGILVLVSEFEREIFIFADKGVTPYVSVKEFQELAGTLARDFNASAPGESFFKAFTELSLKLAPYFPPDDRGNELKDHLRGY